MNKFILQKLALSSKDGKTDSRFKEFFDKLPKEQKILPAKNNELNSSVKQFYSEK